MRLKVNHLVLDKSRIEHGDGGFLERVVGTSIEVATAGTNPEWKVSELPRDTDEGLLCLVLTP